MGPPIRTDIVDVYVFRQPPAPHTGEIEFLQMHRCLGSTLGGTWQPVIGHMHPGETAAQTALRELAEETGFQRGRHLLGFWQLESLNTYFLHSHHCVVMSPCFAAEVPPGVDPVMNAEHDALRWVKRSHTERAFIWPGQRIAIGQIVRDILEPDSPIEPVLRVAF